MYIDYNPDEWVSVVNEQTLCKFHQKYPGMELPFGYDCSCSHSFSIRRATSEEREENRKRRLEREAEKVNAYREFGFS